MEILFLNAVCGIFQIFSEICYRGPKNVNTHLNMSYVTYSRLNQWASKSSWSLGQDQHWRLQQEYGKGLQNNVSSLKIVLTPSPTLLTGCPEDGWEGSWKQVVFGRLPAHPTQRLRRVVFDHCQSSGGHS